MRTPRRSRLLLREQVGRIVRSTRELRTRSGDVFPAGTAFVVRSFWRGYVMLAEWNGTPPRVVRDPFGGGRLNIAPGSSTGREIRMVAPRDVGIR